LRALEDYLRSNKVMDLNAVTSGEVALYILNNKRDYLNDIERRFGVRLGVLTDERMQGGSFTIERMAPDAAGGAEGENNVVVQMDWAFEAPGNGKGESDDDRRRAKRKRRRGRNGREEATYASESPETADGVESEDGESAGSEEEQRARKSRRRGRRGGRRQRARRETGGDVTATSGATAEHDTEGASAAVANDGGQPGAHRDGWPADAGDESDAGQVGAGPQPEQSAPADEAQDNGGKPARKRPSRRRKTTPAQSQSEPVAETAGADEAVSVSAPVPETSETRPHDHAPTPAPEPETVGAAAEPDNSGEAEREARRARRRGWWQRR